MSEPPTEKAPAYVMVTWQIRLVLLAALGFAAASLWYEEPVLGIGAWHSVLSIPATLTCGAIAVAACVWLATAARARYAGLAATVVACLVAAKAAIQALPSPRFAWTAVPAAVIVLVALFAVVSAHRAPAWIHAAMRRARARGR